MSEPSFGLVMPFVVCQSQGGPHADEPFVAGYECGYIDRLLEAKDQPTVERYVHSSIVPQLDLIAMRHGYALTAEPWDEHPDEWTFVRLTLRPSPPIPRGEPDVFGEPVESEPLTFVGLWRHALGFRERRR